ncbi:MAG: DUF4124 domain-containing protein [Rhodocyclaceae bacterium]|nr:DUF4124 domain-containing protein [Rhodocyclaceae bacterium]
MRKSVLLGLALAIFGSSASAGIYKCVDSQGRITYTNDVDNAKGCSKLDEDLPVSSVPALKAPARPAPQAGGTAERDFPRVSPDEQQSRDESRRSILDSELKAEQKALADAEKAFAEQDSIRFGDERNYQKKLDRLEPFKQQVELHRRNIEALQKEITNLR